MGKLKFFLGDILGKIFIVSKIHADRILKSEREKILKKLCTADPTSIITAEANIANFQKDKSKIKIGAFSIVKSELLIFNVGGEIIIGDYCFIGEGTRIWSSKSISVGNRVLISHNVNIHDNNSHPLEKDNRHEDFKYMLENNGFLKKSDLKEKGIIIEDDVWIGFNCTILKGVRIGKGSIIGANSVVTKDVPSNIIAIGNPAKKIKDIN